MKIKCLLFLVIAVVCMPLTARVSDAKAVALLDKVVAAMKADAPLQMDYSYTLCDDEGVLVQKDNGIVVIDGARYALLMENMKVWCDGETQWSYSSDINEIYITEATSDAAQNLSPLYVVEYYRNEYVASFVEKGSEVLVTLRSPVSESDVDAVELLVSKQTGRHLEMKVSMRGQGVLCVALNDYIANCGATEGEFVCPVGEFPSAEVVDMR